MKKVLLAFFFVLLLSPCAFAASDPSVLFDTIHQYSTEELLQLRDLIDAELQQRNADETGKPTYVLNISSRRFHIPSCDSIERMKGANRKDFFGERDELISMNYVPCGSCNP